MSALVSSKFVRASHYRHVHGQAVKPELEFTDLKPNIVGDASHIAVNDKFFCYAGVGGGGPVVVWPISKPQRLPLKLPMLTVHKELVLDFQFSPFLSTLLATCSEDCHVKISSIPDGGLTENLSECVVDLIGHERRINFLQWNTVANNILCSASADNTIRLWDVAAGEERYVATLSDTAHSISWSPDGSTLAVNTKDQRIQLIDPRVNNDTKGNAGGITSSPSFTGTKKTHSLFRGSQQIVATGNSKQSNRQIALWDIRSFGSALTHMDIDQEPGIQMPHYDHDNGLMYIAGKGDSSIRYYEVVDQEPYFYFLAEFRDTASQKGVAWVPKRCVNTRECEIAQCVRLLKEKMHQISFQVPRKAQDTFQKDLYPDAYAGVASMDAKEWCRGKNAEPMKVSMNPKDKKEAKAGVAGPSAPMPSKADTSKSLSTAAKKADPPPSISTAKVAAKVEEPSSPKGSKLKPPSSPKAKSVAAPPPTTASVAPSTTTNSKQTIPSPKAISSVPNSQQRGPKPSYEELEAELAAAYQKIADLKDALRKQIEVFNAMK